MTPDQVRDARKALGLTQTQLARVMKLRGNASVSDWETGVRNIGPCYVLLLRAYLDGYRPDDWPEGE